ncbi:MAG TPA: hypothetical protein VHI13_07200 [Candidatus Kapabacteria bacterium]|nr:hypothetical protein [Candidatus Kapabacteria bacterium]
MNNHHIPLATPDTTPEEFHYNENRTVTASAGGNTERTLEYDGGIAPSAFPLRQIGLQDAELFASPNEIIQPYLHAEGVDQLYHRLLERTELRHGPALVRDILRLLWASRSGRSHDELAAFAGHGERQAAGALETIGNHLLWDDNTVSLCGSFRSVVCERYLPTVELQQQSHLVIAEHLAHGPRTLQRIAEEHWQLHSAQAWSRLLSTILRPESPLALHEAGGTDELFRYWDALVKHYDLAEEYEASLEAFRSGGRECLHAAALFHLLGEFHRDRGDAEQAERLLRRCMTIRLAIRGSDERAAELAFGDDVLAELENSAAGGKHLRERNPAENELRNLLRPNAAPYRAVGSLERREALQT